MGNENFGKSIIAMGRLGMIYSRSSRVIICDAVEYMCNAHCADRLIVAADKNVSDGDVLYISE